MRFLSYGVMIYMLLALVWWAILLNKKNNLVYESKLELLQLTQNQLYAVKEFSIKTSPEFGFIEKEYNKNRYMILGEGIVFGISLILGIWFIQRAYVKELQNKIKQNNFLLSVTHELKSPIASINLITETLLKRKLAPDQEKDLKSSILSESLRLEKLINNLLLTTKINNDFHYYFEPVDIIKVVEDVIKNLKFQYDKASISLHCKFQSLNIIADKEALFSLVNNLVENAIKYSPESSQINITINKSSSDIKMEIVDEGNGIPENEKKKVLQQFYRIGNEDTRQTKGTGLGLYIVDKITKAHKGKLEIQNNIPKGTKFIISLPIKH